MTNRRKVNDEMIMALTDGELAPELAREIERAVAADPDLARRLEEFRRSRDLVREAYLEVADEAVPAPLRSSVEHMLEEARSRAGTAARKPGDVIGFDAAAAAHRARRYRLPVAFAMAAALSAITGYFLGAAMLRDGRPVDRLLPPALLADAGRLQDLLGSLPAGERRAIVAAEPHIDLNMISSFRAREGTLCREFEVAGPAEDDALAVACHAGDGWRVTFFAEGRRTGEGFQPASGMELAETYLHGIEAGEALSLEDEAAALRALKAPRR